MVQAPPMKAWAMAHDGKFGFVIYELDLPASVVERYHTKRNSPDSMLGAIGRLQQLAQRVPQTSEGHYTRRPDTDPDREEPALE